MQLKTLQKNMKDFLQDKAPADFMVYPMSGLNIYKQNYFKNLAGALTCKYPATLEYLKDEARELLHNFICKFPSTSPNLDDYGDEFPRYLTDNNFSLAAKLARLDLEIFTSFKNSEKPLSARELAHLTFEDFDRLTLELNAGLRLIKVDAQAFEAWRKLTSATVKGQSDEKLLYLTISPFEDQIIINIVSVSYHEALALMKNHENLLSITAKILEIDSNFNLSEFLAFCFKNNLITSFNLE